MPTVPFETLPPSARVWVFGAAAPMQGAAALALMRMVDAHLAGWGAHGVPLVCASAWRDDRFLAVAVDEAATGASGCSIDGLFRTLADAETELGTNLVGGSTVFWRDGDGTICAASRGEFRAAAIRGEVTLDTPVFDTTVSTVGAWRVQFERPAGDSWHSRLIVRNQTANSI